MTIYPFAHLVSMASVTSTFTILNEQVQMKINSLPLSHTHKLNQIHLKHLSLSISFSDTFTPLKERLTDEDVISSSCALLFAAQLITHTQRVKGLTKP